DAAGVRYRRRRPPHRRGLHPRPAGGPAVAAHVMRDAPRLTIWAPLPFRRLLASRPDPPPFPLADPRCRLVTRARHGLWLGVRALGLGPGDEVLVPAYHHGSEVEALVRAGVTC